MHAQYQVRLFHNEHNQNLVIPPEFELPGDEAIVRKEGKRLIIEPVRTGNRLAELLASWEPTEEDFPEIEDKPVEPEDIF